MGGRASLTILAAVFRAMGFRAADRAARAFFAARFAFFAAARGGRARDGAARFADRAFGALDVLALLVAVFRALAPFAFDPLDAFDPFDAFDPLEAFDALDAFDLLAAAFFFVLAITDSVAPCFPGPGPHAARGRGGGLTGRAK